jgi:hypothetical protein
VSTRARRLHAEMRHAMWDAMWDAMHIRDALWRRDGMRRGRGRGMRMRMRRREMRKVRKFPIFCFPRGCFSVVVRGKWRVVMMSRPCHRCGPCDRRGPCHRQIRGRHRRRRQRQIAARSLRVGVRPCGW